METNETKSTEAEKLELCEECGKENKKIDLSLALDEARREIMVCGPCLGGLYATCSSCDNYVNRNRVSFCDSCSESYCNPCWNEENHSNHESENGFNLYRPYSDDVVTSRTLGKIVKSRRIFSAEIECYSSENSTGAEIVAETIDKRIGISEDGSLGDKGLEFQTPKLKNHAGEKLLTHLCQTLKANSFYVNTDCGLHIHLDASDYFLKTDSNNDNYIAQNNSRKAKNLLAFYLTIEPIILAFIPPSRRESTYCVGLSKLYHFDEIFNCQSIENLEKLWYREGDKGRIQSRKSKKNDATRYAGVNFHSMLSNKHLEIRFHSGTIEPLKILYWIALHTQIMDMVFIGSILAERVYKKMALLLTLSQKMDYFFNILGLDENIKVYFIKRAKKFNQDLLSEEKLLSPLTIIADSEKKPEPAT